MRGHLAGAWEPDDFRGLSEARKLNLSGVGGWVLKPRIDHGSGGSGFALAHCVTLGLWFPIGPQGDGDIIEGF